MRVGIKRLILVVLQLVLLSGCTQEHYEGWDGKPIPGFEPDKLPLTELHIYQENYTPMPVAVDGKSYYASRVGLCAGTDFSGNVPMYGDFTPARSEYGWVLESNTTMLHDIRNFVKWRGVSTVNTDWFYGMRLNSETSYNVYLIEIDFPYVVEPAPDTIVSYAFVVEESDGSTELIEPDPIELDGSAAVLLGYGFIE